MRLKSFQIQSFKSIEDIRVTMPDVDPARRGSANFLSLVGPNNCGKSSILEALRLVLPSTGLSKADPEHFPRQDTTQGPIFIELTFDQIRPEEAESPGVRHHIHRGEYRVRKVFTASNGTGKWEAWGPDHRLRELPESPQKWSDIANVSDEHRVLVERFQEATGQKTSSKLSKSAVVELVKFAVESNSPLVQTTESWQENPGGIKPNVETVLPTCIFIQAIRETCEETSVSKGKSAARQIVDAMFQRDLAEQPEVIEFNKAIDGLKRLFGGEKGGTDEVIMRLQERITSKLQRLIDLAARFDFEPPDLNADLASKTRLQVVDGDLQTQPELQGNGAQRALILCLLELLTEYANRSEGEGPRRGLLLLVEEPEIYLHPQMCRKMRDVLIEIARSGTAQVICTTHSPVFLDLADRHDGIAILDRSGDGGRLRIQQLQEDVFSDSDGQKEREHLRMVLDFDPTVNEVFFSKNICLVEGDTEVAAFAAACRALSEDIEVDGARLRALQRDTSLINCRGKWTIRGIQRVLNAFGLNYRVVHDGDNEGDRGANLAIRNLAGTSRKVRVHGPNFEGAIFGEELKRDKPFSAYSRISACQKIDGELRDFVRFVLGEAIPARAQVEPA